MALKVYRAFANQRCIRELTVKDIEFAIQRVPHSWETTDDIQKNISELLLIIPQGTKTAFDKKTHRKVTLRTQRMSFIYFIARSLENRDSDEISEDVLNHLENAQLAIRHAWGLSEWERLQDTPFTNFDKKTRQRFNAIIGQTHNNQYLKDFSVDDKPLIVDELGRRVLTELYRQLLISVIGELWVEYLTQMEALRVSIGLEAYGQRDPLVQYKNKAFELFQGLFDDLRTGVVTRMFTYRPRDISNVQSSVSRELPTPENNRSEDQAKPSSDEPRKPQVKAVETDRPKRSGKRRRHRR